MTDAFTLLLIALAGYLLITASTAIHWRFVALMIVLLMLAWATEDYE